jgi:hypothetical protein
MYIIKVKGKKKIPNYIQLRDDQFVLIGYFSWKEGRPMRSLERFGLAGKEDQLESVVRELPYGKLQKLEL